MDVHRPVVPGVAVTPYHVHQVIPAVHPPGVLHQQLDEIVLLGGQLHRLPVPDRHPLFGVQGQVPGGNEAGGLPLGPSGGPAEHGPDAGLQLQDVEGLVDVVVRPAFKADDLVRVLAAGGEHDDGHVGKLPDAHARLQPVDLRHHQIQDDEVEAPRPGQLHRRRTVIGAFHLIALVLQVELDTLYQQALIIHNQYFHEDSSLFFHFPPCGHFSG